MTSNTDELTIWTLFPYIETVMNQPPDYKKMWDSKPFVIFFSAITVLSILLLFSAWRTVQLYDYLLHNGILTAGKVVEHYVRTGSRGYGQNHYFVYRFLDSQGLSHEDKVIRNKPENRFKVGHDIEIIYDPLDSSRNIPSIMVPDNIYKPIYSSVKFMVAALGLTFALGAFVFSRFAQIRLRWASLKRLFGIANR